MKRADRGTKHVCSECATKYYDLKRSKALCPRCGGKPEVVVGKPVRRRMTPRPAPRGGFGRFP